MRFTFTQRAAPFCEVGFDDVRVGHTAAKWDHHAWDTPLAKWSGVEPSWRDVSCEVWEASCEYGRASLTDRYVPGQANIIARNLDGWGDPQQSGLRPGRAIRFGVDHVEHGRVVLFRGFIDAVVPVYDPSHTPTVELQCIDALAEVNRATLLAFPEPYPGQGDLPHERIATILTRARWPESKRDLKQSSVALMADAQGGQVADLLGRIADSSGGAVWGDKEARIGFRSRDWQMFNPVTPVDATLGNVEPTDVCPGTWERPFDRASISTRVVFGRDPETAIVQDDDEGMALYGMESLERLDLLTLSDADIVSLAARTLATRSHTTMPRVRSVSLDARMGPRQLDVMTLADPFTPTHYRCRLVEQDGRLVFDDRYMTTALAHTITADVWQLEMNLDLAAPYAVAGGRWDQAGWDQATWTQPLVTA